MSDPTTPVRVELLTRVGCHLCDDARAVVRDVCAEAGARWVERDVDADPDLLARYSEEVPVVLVDGAQHAYWKVDAQALRDALADPGARGPLRWLRRGR
ncbi:glutaredoxin family protein [Thalassiella azotivora]